MCEPDLPSVGALYRSARRTWPSRAAFAPIASYFRREITGAVWWQRRKGGAPHDRIEYLAGPGAGLRNLLVSGIHHGTDATRRAGRRSSPRGGAIMSDLASHLENFLREYLPRDRRASVHTRDSYAYAFQMLVSFAARRLSSGRQGVRDAGGCRKRVDLLYGTRMQTCERWRDGSKPFRNRSSSSTEPRNTTIRSASAGCRRHCCS